MSINVFPLAAVHGEQLAQERREARLMKVLQNQLSDGDSTIPRDTLKDSRRVALTGNQENLTPGFKGAALFVVNEDSTNVETRREPTGEEYRAFAQEVVSTANELLAQNGKRTLLEAELGNPQHVKELVTDLRLAIGRKIAAGQAR